MNKKSANKRPPSREDLEDQGCPYDEVIKYPDPTLFRSELSRNQVKFINKWIKELRGGKYKQCFHTMTTGRAYDALGIGCLVCGVRPKKEGSKWTFGGNEGFLPEAVIERLGLRDEEAGCKNFRLNVLNDELWTFDQIAELIEKSFKLNRKNAK